MPLKVLQAGSKIANLILKDHVIRYIELKSRQPLSIAKYGEKFLPEGIISDGKIVSREMLESILEQCIQTWKIRRRRIRFIVPDSYVAIRKLSIPSVLKGEEIRGYLSLELGETIPLPFEQSVFDFVPLQQISDEAQEILLFAAPKQTVLEYTQLFEKLKLKPIAADISPLSLYRLLYILKDINPKEHLLLVQCDLSSVHVTVFHEHYPLFTRQLNVEMNIEDWEQIQIGNSNKYYLKWTGTKEGLNLQFENVITEIDRVINFYRFSFQQEEQQINRIILTGDHPSFHNIYQLMVNRFNIPVKHIDDEVAQVLRDSLDSSYYLPLGLALKEVR
jgi:type IV pilus assembly protein PilM